jgi:hypothetical protein
MAEKGAFWPLFRSGEAVRFKASLRDGFKFLQRPEMNDSEPIQLKYESSNDV